MNETFRKIQRALEAGNDALFEASRGKLEPEVAESIQRTRELMTEGLAALVRLEAEILRQREESARWTQVGKLPSLTRTVQP
jgi:hypothetical protein